MNEKLLQMRHRLAHRISYFTYCVSGAKKRNEKQLALLKDSFEGKRFFIVCNGPSLKAEDLTKIYNSGDVSIGFNAIPRIYDQTPWRPKFLSATDDAVFDKKNRKMVEESFADYKLYDATRYLHSLKSKGKKLYLRFDERLELLDYPVFDSNAFGKLPSIGTSVYSIMEFAVFLGCKEFYIIGCDMSYSVNLNRDGTITYSEQNKNHFYAQDDDAYKPTKEKPALTWQLEVAYDHIAKYARENGIKVYNATRGGKLESFPRVDFDDLF